MATRTKLTVKEAKSVEGEEVPDPLRHALYMCPTHHYCYDKYQLEDSELSIMRRTVYGYNRVITGVFENVIVPNSPNEREMKKIDKSLDMAWGWWRVYINGNN